jgi:hypothetical protein
MTYEAKTTDLSSALCSEDSPTSNKAETPRRRRTIKDAEAMLDRELDLSPTEKRQAMMRIRRAPQPRREARRIIEHCRAGVVGDVCRHNGTVDLSDAQELRVKLVNRDDGIWPPQRTTLHELECQIAKGEITPAQFRAKAAVLLAMPQALPKSFRKVEATYLQE